MIRSELIVISVSSYCFFDVGVIKSPLSAGSRVREVSEFKANQIYIVSSSHTILPVLSRKKERGGGRKEKRKCSLVALWGA